jgi:uncharacterized membrane protein YfcA
LIDLPHCKYLWLFCAEYFFKKVSIELFLLFFIIALAYSSVGFGGGSSYLAFLSLIISDFFQIRTLGLVLNLVVVSLGTLAHYRKGYIDKRAFLPFILFSMIFAFWGARFRLDESTFFILLGGSLIASSLFMILQTIKKTSHQRKLSLLQKAVLGSGVGFLSGLVGIGGGIFLSPTLNLIGWRNPRSVAALSSTYILFNSTAGLIGLLSSDSFSIEGSFALPLIFAVLLGGIIGSNLSASRLKVHLIKGLTGVLVAYVGCRLVLFHAFQISI